MTVCTGTDGHSFLFPLYLLKSIDSPCHARYFSTNLLRARQPVARRDERTDR